MLQNKLKKWTRQKNLTEIKLLQQAQRLETYLQKEFEPALIETVTTNPQLIPIYRFIIHEWSKTIFRNLKTNPEEEPMLYSCSCE
jgi:hypothetical protein